MSTSERRECGFFDTDGDTDYYTRRPLGDEGYEGNIDEDATPPQLTIYPMGASDEALITTWVSADATSSLVIKNLEDMR